MFRSRRPPLLRCENFPSRQDWNNQRKTVPRNGVNLQIHKGIRIGAFWKIIERDRYVRYACTRNWSQPKKICADLKTVKPIRIYWFLSSSNRHSFFLADFSFDYSTVNMYVSYRSHSIICQNAPIRIPLWICKLTPFRGTVFRWLFQGKIFAP